MASLLLDSHVLLWYDTEPTRLSKGASNAIRSVGSKIYVSPVSIYELAYKVERQMLPHAKEMIDQLEVRIRAYDFELLEITSMHALRAARLAWDHRDPFDRLIAAQALDVKCVLVTKDVVFQGVPSLKIMW